MLDPEYYLKNGFLERQTNYIALISEYYQKIYKENLPFEITKNNTTDENKQYTCLIDLKTIKFIDSGKSKKDAKYSTSKKLIYGLKKEIWFNLLKIFLVILTFITPTICRVNVTNYVVVSI